MNKISSITELKESIEQLEKKQANEKELLIEEFRMTIENLRSVDFIKHKINDIISDPDLKKNMLNTTLGLIAGYLSKKMIIGSTHNPLKQLFGTLLQAGVTAFVSKNGEGIRSTVMNLVSNLLHKNKETE